MRCGSEFKFFQRYLSRRERTVGGHCSKERYLSFHVRASHLLWGYVLGQGKFNWCVVRCHNRAVALENTGIVNKEYMDVVVYYYYRLSYY